MTDQPSFSAFAPGFEFLQGLVKNAGASLPGMGQWIAPTLDPEELDKRIQELRTVQFWLEQNARMLGATIQALEVQKMTLTTLQTMNVQMSDLRDALTIRTPTATAATPAPSPAPEKPPVATPEPPVRAEAVAAPDIEAKPAVDPLQWWGAVTQQFSELAAAALKDGAAATVAQPSKGPKAPVAAPRASQPAAKTAAVRSARSGATPAPQRAARKSAARRPR
jgi:hypothetical protein